ncbi:LLM class flavin-dependent oxidoreductase [Pedococcus sp. 5OH_020]|uniref:LLM class flavin-dependent oxidoreductase n=1 Tax=Pedococcus sp. 5OH_020 TaxID=2989814 RepID=UPI0022EA033A|nr:LLM class flavin-dependent oxidoreductase [Pedococcus sp. 5OH_020]
MSAGAHGVPDPALVVLVGAAGAGKSTWAAARYRTAEIVSSDALRAVVGSGEHDLDASADAFAVLDRIVAARLRRKLTVVVDTLGLDTRRRQEWLALGRAAGLPCVAVLFDTPPRLVRERNSARGRPVPAAVLGRQLARLPAVATELHAEGWHVVTAAPGSDEQRDDGPRGGRTTDPADAPDTRAGALTPRQSSLGVELVLQVSRFPWAQEPAAWLSSVCLAADQCGFSGLALMDHLIQIPQVDRAWEPIPEPWVTLGLLAGLETDLRLGTLVSPVTFRAPGLVAKTVATLDVLSRGRAFLGLGAGWWEREHLAFGLPFPPAHERLDLLERSIETIRALWGAGTKPYTGSRVTLPETTAYPRPLGQPQIIVGGGGEARTLRIAAAQGDACNVPSDLETLDRKIAVLRRHCAAVGREAGEVAITVLDVPVVGRDRDDAWNRVERLRGRTSAAAFAARHHAGPADSHRDRYKVLADRGVRTVFVSLPDLDTAADVERLGDVLQPR